MNERERRAYIEQMEAQLEAWKADLARLKAETEPAGAVERLSRTAAEELRGRVEAAGRKLEELRGAGEAHWAGAKAAVEAAWKELKDVWQETRGASAGEPGPRP